MPMATPEVASDHMSEDVDSFIWSRATVTGENAETADTESTRHLLGVEGRHDKPHWPSSLKTMGRRAKRLMSSLWNSRDEALCVLGVFAYTLDQALHHGAVTGTVKGLDLVVGTWMTSYACTVISEDREAKHSIGGQGDATASNPPRPTTVADWLKWNPIYPFSVAVIDQMGWAGSFPALSVTSPYILATAGFHMFRDSCAQYKANKRFFARQDARNRASGPSTLRTKTWIRKNVRPTVSEDSSTQGSEMPAETVSVTESSGQAPQKRTPRKKRR